MRRATGRLLKFPSALKRKVGPIGPLDEELVSRAEAALSRLSNNFGPWLAEEVTRLAGARANIRSSGYNAETAAALNIRVHEIKSLAATYGFPLVTQIAESLCRLVENEDTRLDAPIYLLDAHIDAIKAAVRDGVRSDDDETGRALLAALDQQVRSFGVTTAYGSADFGAPEPSADGDPPAQGPVHRTPVSDF
jgi:hypothetical protein